jgi:hypothetical protein
MGCRFGGVVLGMRDAYDGQKQQDRAMDSHRDIA